MIIGICFGSLGLSSDLGLFPDQCPRVCFQIVGPPFIGVGLLPDSPGHDAHMCG